MIQSKQNHKDFIRLLKAQRVAYNKAKKHYGLDIIVILLAVILTGTTIYNNDQDIIGLITVGSFALFFIVIFSELMRAKQIKDGAIIQEEFEVKLFEIPQNKVLVPNFLTDIQIVELSNLYENHDLENWFSKENDNNLQKEHSILLAHKENCTWSILLREKFVRLIITLSFFYALILIIVLFWYEKNLYEVAYCMAPSIPLFTYVANVLKNLIEINNKYKELDRTIDKYLIETVDEITLRQLQDLFFLQRCNPVETPDWFYRHHAGKINSTVSEVVKIAKNKIINKIKL